MDAVVLPSLLNNIKFSEVTHATNVFVCNQGIMSLLFLFSVWVMLLVDPPVPFEFAVEWTGEQGYTYCAFAGGKKNALAGED